MRPVVHTDGVAVDFDPVEKTRNCDFHLLLDYAGIVLPAT